MLGLDTKHDLPTILIIDDDMVSREVMATVLTMSGFMVHTASDAMDALAILDAGSWAAHRESVTASGTLGSVPS